MRALPLTVTGPRAPTRGEHLPFRPRSHAPPRDRPVARARQGRVRARLHLALGVRGRHRPVGVTGPAGDALRRRVEGVSEKTLSQTLRSLERDGPVTRDVVTAIPPGVEYALTRGSGWPPGCATSPTCWRTPSPRSSGPARDTAPAGPPAPPRARVR
ncbi:winged helix-turn-helix transcriptional regulator [Geodermatophilus normandii]|uniref:winged helix-turn-helix transcriptional regulator n=1 Tax=Geodermatophilus normandii TaxID=1137989 RepID=UPI001B873F1D